MLLLFPAKFAVEEQKTEENDPCAAAKDHPPQDAVQ